MKVTLDKTPPELAADIMEQGIVLAGGGALLHGLDARLEHETGMPIVIAAQPAALRGDRLGAVARGVRGAEGRALLLAHADLTRRSWLFTGVPDALASRCSCSC